MGCHNWHLIDLSNGNRSIYPAKIRELMWLFFDKDFLSAQAYLNHRVGTNLVRAHITLLLNGWARKQNHGREPVLGNRMVILPDQVLTPDP